MKIIKENNVLFKNLLNSIWSDAFNCDWDFGREKHGQLSSID